VRESGEKARASNSSVKEPFNLELMRLKLPFGTQTGQYKYV